MSNRMRWRYGDTNPVIAAVDESVAVEIGDLLYLDGDNARPASLQPGQETEAANQVCFAENFLGIAMQESRPGEATPVRVATTGVFEFNCYASTFELGNLIGVSENLLGTGLLDQAVELVPTADRAIGRVARRESSSSTSVLVDMRSTIMTGGVYGTTAQVTEKV